MEPEPLLPVPDIIGEIDLTASATSAEHYLAQVIVGRRNCPTFVYAPDVKRNRPADPFPTSETGQRSPFAPSEEWIHAKCLAFKGYRTKIAEKRERIEDLTCAHWPSVNDDNELWVHMALMECDEQAEYRKEQFPNHRGTPPSLSVVTAMTETQIQHLLNVLLEEWDEETEKEQPTAQLRIQLKAILEWVYALLLVIDLPLMPEMSANMRTFTKSLRDTRSKVGEGEDSEERPFSLFIALIGRVLGQSDLAD